MITLKQFYFVKTEMSQQSEQKQQLKPTQSKQEEQHPQSHQPLSSISNATSTFIKIAAREAQNSDMFFKHGCALIANGKILARGHNHTRNSISNQAKQLNLPNGLAPLCSLHAEMHCLLNFAKVDRKHNQHNHHHNHSHSRLSTDYLYNPCLLPGSHQRKVC